MAIMTYIDAINTALREEMRRDPCVFIIGEDVGKMGGAFKATKGLLDEFGSERVIENNPVLTASSAESGSCSEIETPK